MATDEQQYSENFADDQQYSVYNDQTYAEAMDQSGEGATGEVNGTNGTTKTASDDDSWDTDGATVKEYFTKFGEVLDVTLKTDPATGKSRGFGFVTFATEEAVDNVLKNLPHSIKGKQVDPKRAKVRPGIKKIFVGGLDIDYPEADIKSYFEKYGKVEQVELPFDKVKNQRRQFCFVTFETEEACEMSCKQAKQKIGNKECDVKKATNKPDPRAAGRGGFGGFGGRGGARGGRGAARGRGGPGFTQPQGWGGAPGGYGGGYGGQYGSYGQGGYGTGGYGNYDYNYGAGGYGGSGYGGYDYSGWNYGQNSGGYGAAGGYGQQPSSYGKTPRRGGAVTSGSGAAAGYHPYSR